MPRKNPKIPERVKGIALAADLQQQYENYKLSTTRQLSAIRKSIEGKQGHSFSPEQLCAADSLLWAQFSQTILGSQGILWLRESMQALSISDLERAGLTMNHANKTFGVVKAMMAEKRSALRELIDLGQGREAEEELPALDSYLANTD